MHKYILNVKYVLPRTQGYITESIGPVTTLKAVNKLYLILLAKRNVIGITTETLPSTVSKADKGAQHGQNKKAE